MILENMTYSEIEKDVSEDFEEIKERAWRVISREVEKRPKEFRRKYPEGKRFKTGTMFSSGNHYFYIPSARFLDSVNLKRELIVYVRTYRERGDPLFIRIPGKGGRELRGDNLQYRSAAFFTSHFLKRYEERFLGGEGRDLQEVFETFIIRNTNFLTVSDLKEEEGMVARVNDGIILGTRSPDNHILWCKTFLSDDTLGKTKEELYGKSGDLWEQHQIIEEFLKREILNIDE